MDTRTTTPVMSIDLTTLTPERLQTLEADLLAQILDRAPMLERIIAAARARAMDLLRSDSQTFGGTYFLKDGATTEKLHNTEEAVKRLLLLRDSTGDRLLIAPKELLALAKLSVPDIRGLIKTKLGLTAEEAKTVTRDTLGDVVIVAQNAPSLKRKE